MTHPRSLGKCIESIDNMDTMTPDNWSMLEVWHAHVITQQQPTGGCISCAWCCSLPLTSLNWGSSLSCACSLIWASCSACRLNCASSLRCSCSAKCCCCCCSRCSCAKGHCWASNTCSCIACHASRLPVPKPIWTLFGNRRSTGLFWKQ